MTTGEPPPPRRNAASGTGPVAISTLGGSTKGRPSSESIKEIVETMGGNRPIRSVLIANNGIAAVKFIRSVRTWTYKVFGSERAVTMVAMATPDDMRINAEHIRMADQFVEVPGGSNHNNYANVALIIEIAERAGVDAVWPGWGHASENPDLPTALLAAGIAFLGPPAGPMAALGDKIGSTILAQAAGVPTVPWSGSHVAMSYSECGGNIPPEIYRQACVYTTEEAIASCERIGYPVMIKASWGGGGKGIRKVHNAKEVRVLFPQVQGEVPGSPIFTMKVAPQSRHLEVQLLGDIYGNVAALHGRDCSVQRRHQKIIEEGPVTVAPQSTLRELERSAQRLAQGVGYVGAATVEYLYSEATGEYYFLELNPRLQVEHPVTEWISGVNLPACQLAIAMGIPLWRIPEIRAFYGAEPELLAPAPPPAPIDFTSAVAQPPRGHVIAVRITSEDPDDGFKPTSGAIEELSFRSTPDVWGYFSVKGAGGIHEFSDSQFGHLFAKGENRASACQAMVLALKDVAIRGEIRTIVDYVIDLLRSPEYQSNHIHTGWLDSRIAMRIRAERPEWHVSVICGALHRAISQSSARVAEFTAYLGKGQCPPATGQLSLTSFSVELVLEGVKYVVALARRDTGAFCLTLGGASVEAEVRTLRDGGLLVQLDGSSHVVYAEEEALGTRLLINGQTCLLANENDPSRMLAVTTGKLLRRLVEEGAHVTGDQPIAEIEVMKMCMPLMAPVAGRIAWAIAEGSSIKVGDLLAHLELDDPSAVCRAVPFTGCWPPMGAPSVPLRSDKVATRFQMSLAAAKHLLAGYEHSPDAVATGLLRSLEDPELPLALWSEAWGTLAARLPRELREELETGAVARYRDMLTEFLALPAARAPVGLTSAAPEFPAAAISGILQCWIEVSGGGEPAATALVTPLMELADAHAGGRESFAAAVAADLLDSFLRVEERWSGGADIEQADVIESLRLEHAGRLSEVVELVLSHQAAARKAILALRLVNAIIAPGLSRAAARFRPLLRRLAALCEPTQAVADLAARASELLQATMMGELRAGVARSLSGAGLNKYVDAAPPSNVNGSSSGAALSKVPKPPAAKPPPRTPPLAAGIRRSFESGESMELRMAALVDCESAVEDALAGLLNSPDPQLQRRVVEVYVRRLYHPFLVPGSLSRAPGDPALLTWRFQRGETLPLWQGPGQPLGQVVGMIHGSDVATAALALVAGVKDVRSAIAAAVAALNAVPAAAVGEATVGMSIPAAGPPAGETAVGPAVLHLVLTSADDELNAAPGASGNGGGSGSEGGTPTCGSGIPLALQLSALLEADKGSLRDAGIGLISVLVCRTAPTPEQQQPARHHPHHAQQLPTRYGFRWEGAEGGGAFVAEALLQHVEAPQAQLLELHRLANFAPRHALSHSRQWHLFVAQEASGDMRSAHPLRRVFLRGTLRQLALAGGEITTAGLQEVDQALAGAAAELARAGLDPDSRAHSGDWAHIFLAGLPALALPHNPSTAAALRVAAAQLAHRHTSALRAAGVAEWELRLRSTEGSAWRVLVSDPSGHESAVNVYLEAMDSSTGRAVYAAVTGSAGSGPLVGTPLSAPYPPLGQLARKRLLARSHRTTYCYDLPAAIEAALRDAWAAMAGSSESNIPHAPLLEATELALPTGGGEAGPLVAVERPPAHNSIGMVAWSLLLRTPECPDGRHVVLIANDVTHGAGAFGTAEDAVFKCAVERALVAKLPVIYIAANSGARIGVAEEVRRAFRVAWVDDGDLAKGLEYLYLTPEDAARLGGSVVTRSAVGPSGDPRYVITDIIGAEHGLGVENLSGSGAIAGAYARAYADTFTLTYVSGRTVGIGAYLARLGQRCIQRADGPIILTGFAALNKLLGREVYSSHQQLGGPRVMAVNGVVHAVVEDDLAGAAAILRWLSYVPSVIGGPLPIRDNNADPIDRPVAYICDRERPCDPRAAICGVEGDAAGQPDSHVWLGGLFDRGSFMETQSGWARTVVTGRARLGGVPIGVIAVEVATVMNVIPADPGMPDSHERVVPQAGQVWFPDSAEKTAQTVQECAREGLPLFILANWRGFSGGQRDLYEGVLQAGSRIVQELRQYRKPVFVYIPPGGELRGGAWVVVDSQINPAVIEMYADPAGRGGVLEPEGMVEIKYRPRELAATMHRLDPELIALDAQKGHGLHAGGSSKRAATTRAREQHLMAPYRAAAVRFAELHDTPARMTSKGAIRAAIPWTQARSFFGHRLRRRLADAAAAAELAAAACNVEAEPPSVTLKALAEGAGINWLDDKAVAGWYSSPAGKSSLAEAVQALKIASDSRLFDAAVQAARVSLGAAGTLRAALEAIGVDPNDKIAVASILQWTKAI